MHEARIIKVHFNKSNENNMRREVSSYHSCESQETHGQTIFLSIRIKATKGFI